MASPSVAIITGGAGDIGRAIARHLAPTHSHLVLLDVDKGKLEEACEKFPIEIREKISYKVCDVTDSNVLSGVASELFPAGSATSLKTLVNNAGGTKVGSLHEMTPESWKREISLNLDAAYLCFHAFSQALLRNANDDNNNTGSSIINISSVNGFGTFGNPAYSTAKAGLIHFTRSLAVEYAKFGIRANVVAPGTVMTDGWKGKVESNPAVFDELTRWFPSGRLVDVDEVASVVAFLASDQGKGINGVCLPVDGGLTAGMPPVARSFGVSDYY